MAICANQGRMYMGTARQYMEKSCNCDSSGGLKCHENGCHPASLCDDLPLAMAYMTPQPYTGLVNPDMALARGSAFNNLFDPWKPIQRC